MNRDGQKFTPELIARIQAWCEANPTLSRRKLSLQVCEWLEWRSPNGELKEVSCRVALLALHRQGVLRLPPAGKAPPKRTPRPLAMPDSRDAVRPCEVDLAELGPLEIIAIKNSDTPASRVWNDLMDCYHYLGAGPLCGAQQRYLIQSPNYGEVGGFAFSVPLCGAFGARSVDRLERRGPPAEFESGDQSRLAGLPHYAAPPS